MVKPRTETQVTKQSTIETAKTTGAIAARSCSNAGHLEALRGRNRRIFSVHPAFVDEALLLDVTASNRKSTAVEDLSAIWKIVDDVNRRFSSLIPFLAWCDSRSQIHLKIL